MNIEVQSAKNSNLRIITKLKEQLLYLVSLFIKLAGTIFYFVRSVKLKRIEDN